MIALEGIDGVGKSTATQQLAARLTAEGLDVVVHDFPVYDEPRFGPLIAAFLRGDVTVSGEQTPYVVATLFAGNRAATAPQLRAELQAGKTLVCDRYHVANAAYQGAKLEDAAQLDDFLDWVLDVELNVFGALKPDVSVWLKLPLELRPQADRSDREYLQGKEDVHEKDAALQQRVHDCYAKLAAKGLMTTVDLAPDGALLSPENVADAVYAAAITAGAPNA